MSTTIGTTTLPTTGTYTLDASHSHVGFKVRHLMSKVRGRFSDVEATVVIAAEPLDSRVDVTVDLASIDTRDANRDAHLRSADFFDVDSHSAMTFRSTGLRQVGDDRYELDGELTIAGVTRPLTLQVTFDGVAVDPWGNERAGFSATGRLNREAFGLTWNQALETGGLLVGKDVDLEIEAEIVRQA